MKILIFFSMLDVILAYCSNFIAKLSKYFHLKGCYLHLNRISLESSVNYSVLGDWKTSVSSGSPCVLCYQRGAEVAIMG